MLTMKWKQISHTRFHEMLGMLPPALQTSNGFLFGETYTHRRCALTGRDDAPAFAAFAHVFGLPFEAQGHLTVAEFRALGARDISDNAIRA